MKAALSAYNTGQLHHAQGARYTAKVYAAAAAFASSMEADRYHASSAIAWEISPPLAIQSTSGWQSIATIQYGPGVAKTD